MKNPTVNGNDLYQVGNDYPQAPISAYFEEDSYADGIYTKITNTDFDVKSQDGHDDSFFAGKTPVGLNKRVLNVLPQSGWDDVASGAIFSDDYATAEFTGFPGVSGEEA
jgi:hypothetical protein